MTELGVDGITVSPGYAYERAPDQEHFLNRADDQASCSAAYSRARQRRQALAVQPVGACSSISSPATRPTTARRGAIPTRTVFGWQRPCYLLGEGYAETFKELMEETDWDAYGIGNYEKCANCMVHSGFEATAVDRQRSSGRWKALAVTLRGVRTDGPDGAGHPARQAAAGRIRVLDATSPQKLADIRQGRSRSPRRRATAE